MYGLCHRKAQRFVRCDAGGGIVNVVDGGERDIDFLCVLAHPHVESASVCVGAVYRRHGDVGSSARVTALWTREAAEVSVNVVVIFKIAAAFRAFACVSQVYVALFADTALKTITDHLIEVSE